MTLSRIYADFQNLDDANRLRLTCAGTLQDLERHGIQLQEGLVLTFYTDDADERGQPDELRAEGVVHYDMAGQCWVATIDWNALRHASEEKSPDVKQNMDEFQFAGQRKFTLVAVENVYTDFPENKDHKHQLSDGTWIFGRMPVTLDAYWKEWIGTIRLKQLENSNLIMMYSESSTAPRVLDNHHERLRKRLSQTFSLLQLSGVLEYKGASLLCGSFFDDKSEIRQMSEIPFFYHTKGYTRTPVTVERLEKAIQLRKALEEIDSVPDAFKRLKWGWMVLMDGLQKEHGEERIHQFVRSLEALILPEIGKTKRQFTHRCQTFAKASPNTTQILEEAFELRSMAEHINDWEQALGSHPKDDREIIALHRTRQMEQLASFAYSRILENEAVRSHFISETKQGEFWRLPDSARKNVWGTQLDLTLIKEVRSFDSWGRAL